MTRLLKETTKELDLIDSAICTFVWRVCNNTLFEEIRCTDFIWLMNLREPIPRIKKRNRKDGRICYMICELSKHIYRKNLTEHWINTIQELVTDSGNSKLVTKYQQDRPLCFDYALVSEKYGISLETFIGEQEEDKPEAQQQDLPF